jgi:excisionase family DNA binding protein
MNLPLAYTIAEACSVARAGRTALYEAIRSGALRAVKRGRRTIVLADDLRRYLEALPAVEPKAWLKMKRPGRGLNHRAGASSITQLKARTSWDYTIGHFDSTTIPTFSSGLPSVRCTQPIRLRGELRIAMGFRSSLRRQLRGLPG